MRKNDYSIVSIFLNAGPNQVKRYVVTEMIFIGVLKNKRERLKSEKKVLEVLEFIKSKNWKTSSLPDKALKHIKKNSLEVNDPQYYKKLIQTWKNI